MVMPFPDVTIPFGSPPTGKGLGAVRAVPWWKAPVTKPKIPGTGLAGRSLASPAGAVVATGISSYALARQAQKWMTPETSTLQPYLQGSWLGFQPNPELFYKQQGGAQPTMTKEQAQARWDAAQAMRKVKEQELTTSLPAGAQQSYYDADGNLWMWDNRSGQYIKVGFDPTKVYQQPQQGYPAPAGNVPQDPYGRTATWDTDNAEWRYPPDWGVDPVTRKTGYVSPVDQANIDYQNRYLQWQRDQETARGEAERQQRLATLRANPASWLEYASLAGTTPSIQPWMLPLAPQQYQGMQAGQPLPGWQAQGASLGSLPQLTTPSRQYQARMTPSARAQYGGYEQARTGMTPEDLQWRLWSQAPPGGQFGGLQWQR